MERINFLKSIESKSKSNKYKRVVVSPIRYAGGKSLAVGNIIEHLPDDVKKVVSPFFGGGSIEIAMSSILGIEVIGYDIFDVLINYWNIQINRNKELYEKLLKIEPDKETYTAIRLKLKDHWEKRIKLNDLDLAVHYYFNHNLSYGPGFLGWTSAIYLDKAKYLRILKRVRDFEPKNLKVFCDTFENVLEKHREDFLYLDPPYHIGEDSKTFKGIYPMRNIPIHHNGFKHKLLAELLKKHKGQFILSYNDSEYIRNLYKGFKILSPSWQYTMGQGETRIGKNREEGGMDHIKKSHELLILNVD